MKIISTIVIALVILSVESPAWSAPNKSEDEIRFRQSGMMFMRWNMGRIKQQVLKNPQSYNKAQVASAAEAVAAIANSGIETLFSADSQSGSGWKKTLVKPEFFQQNNNVRELVETLRKETRTLATLSHTGGIAQIGRQFKVVLKACKACHKKYRSKE